MRFGIRVLGGIRAGARPIRRVSAAVEKAAQALVVADVPADSLGGSVDEPLRGAHGNAQRRSNLFESLFLHVTKDKGRPLACAQLVENGVASPERFTRFGVHAGSFDLGDRPAVREQDLSPDPASPQLSLE